MKLLRTYLQNTGLTNSSEVAWLPFWGTEKDRLLKISVEQLYYPEDSDRLKGLNLQANDCI
jgi:hypothetical protein